MLILAADTASTAGAGGASMLPIIIIGALLGLSLYFIPTIVAFKKDHINKIGILVLNVFLGWSFIGWVIALIWSVMKKNTSTK